MIGAGRCLAAGLLALCLGPLAVPPALAESPECDSCTARHKSLQALQAARTGRAGAGAVAAPVAGPVAGQGAALLPPPAGGDCAEAAGDGACPARIGAAAGSPAPAEDG
ncbi:MAG: hypothetical protein NXH83_13965 [Rhodobacteraceae bacterium]|nr:hypothetical protein [Paracoccaceae bacterium]